MQILNKCFGSLAEQIYEKYICLHFYSFRGKTQCCHDLEGLEVKAGHNLGSEAFFPIQMNPVWSVEFICLDVFLKKWHFCSVQLDLLYLKSCAD